MRNDKPLALTPLSLMLALANIGLTLPAAAQVEDDNTLALEEIVVTATKRATSLMETPKAITAITASALDINGITNALQIEKVVPNLKVSNQSTLGMGAVQLNMRGIGNSNFTEQGDPNVGFHVDGIYLSRPQAAMNLMFDVDRIEVLRGPQGTLFGRNSTVGTINVINARPDMETFNGKFDVQAGTYDDRVLKGLVNIPVSDTFAVRGTFYTQTRDSYFDLDLDTSRFGTDGTTNPYLRLGDPADEEDGAGSLDHTAYRLSALWEPNDSASVYFAYENYDNESPGEPLTVHGNEYEAALDMPHIMDMEIESLRLEAAYEFNDAVEVKYSYGKTDYEHEMTIDLDAGVSRFQNLATSPDQDSQFFWDRPFQTDSYSHELQVSSTTDAPVQWILGYFKFKEDTFRNLWIDLPRIADGLLNFTQPSRVAESEAVFASVDWQINDKFALRTGIRYTEDQKTDSDGGRYDAFPGDGAMGRFGVPVALEELGVSDLDYITGVDTGGLPGISRVTGFPANPGTPRARIAELTGFPAAPFDRNFFNDESWDNTDISVTLEYLGDNGALYYGSVATGYKSGTFQDTYFLPRTYQVFTPVLNPEELINYEVGAKFSLNDGAANVAVAAYYMDYEEKQEGVLVNFGDQFCPYTFGDFDGDGFVEDFVPGLTGIPIFSQVRFDPVTLENNPTDAEIAQCASANFDSGNAMQDMVELVPLNVSDAKLAGIEVEWNWNITQHDRISGFLTATLRNEVGNVDTSEFPFTLTDALACADRVGGCPDVSTLNGNDLPFSPDLSLNVNYAHDFDLAENGMVTAWVNLNYSDEYWLTLWNVECYESIATGEQVCDNGDKVDSYVTVDLNVRYTAPSEKWYLEAYGLNVFDEIYATFNRRNGNDNVVGYAFNAPAQYGLRFGYSW